MNPVSHFLSCRAMRLPVVILIVALSLPGLSQNIELIDQLNSQLPAARGKERFELLNQLAWEYRASYPDSAIRLATQAEALGQTLALSTARSLNYIGVGNNYKGNYIRAYDFYERARGEAEVKHDSTQLAHSHNNIGRLLSEQGMITQSYPYFVKAEALFEGLHDPSGLAYVYQSFGSVYKMQKDFIKAEMNYQKALQIRVNAGNTRDIMSAMVQLGSLYMDIGRPDDALYYFHGADSAGRIIHDGIGLAEIKILIAEYYLGKDNLKEAETLCTEGLAYILGSKNVKLVPRAYLVLGQIYFKKKEYAIARKYFTIAVTITTRMKYLDLSMQSHYFLWKISTLTHDRAEELLHSNQYLILKDSIKDLDLAQKIAQFQFQLKIERQQQENELLRTNEVKNEAVIKHQNTRDLALVLTVVFISALLLIQWHNSRKRKLINEALLDQKNQIEKQRGEIEKQLGYIEEKHKEVLIREEEIKRINIQLLDKVEVISRQNNTLETHLNTLLDFSRSKYINFGSISDAAMQIARITSESLSISRVSIWRYDEQNECLETLACFSLKEKQFHETIVLDLNLFPRYKDALKTRKIINAPQAREHGDTREFTESYLKPLNIHSMLDVMFSLDGKLGGLICCEQTDSRTWSPEDIIFARSVSDIISLTYRSAQRREYEKNIRLQSREIARMNETLEQRVRERTEELENQNKQLSEYAFINSHLLRSPVSKILGLINLTKLDHTSNEEIIVHLQKSCEELDSIVKKITIALDSGEHFSRSIITREE